MFKKKIMKQDKEKINSHLNGASSVVLEAAHIYADKTPGDEQRIGAEIASELSESFHATVRKALLIDDFNITAKTLDTGFYLEQLKSWGFSPDDVFMESDLVPAAPDLVNRIKALKSAKVKNWDGRGSRIWSPNGMVGLIKPDGRPTCPALDALLYEKKSRLAQAAVTVLPLSYADQQIATQTVMEKAGISIPIVNVFFDAKGGRTLVLNGR